MYPIRNTFINKFFHAIRIPDPRINDGLNDVHPAKLFVVDNWNKFVYFIQDAFERPDLVCIRDAAKTYETGYLDASERYLYASFAVLVDFVENEMYNGYTAWEDESMIESAKEIEALYKWWTVDRVNEENEYSDVLHTLYHREGMSLSDVIKTLPIYKTPEQEARLQELDMKPQLMLERLTKIRKHLWT